MQFWVCLNQTDNPRQSTALRKRLIPIWMVRRGPYLFAVGRKWHFWDETRYPEFKGRLEKKPRFLEWILEGKVETIHK